MNYISIKLISVKLFKKKTHCFSEVKARHIGEKESISYHPIEPNQWSLWTSSQDHLLNQSSVEKRLTFPWPSFLNFLSGLERSCPGNSKWNLKILSPGFVNISNANEGSSSRRREWNISFMSRGMSGVSTHLWKAGRKGQKGPGWGQGGENQHRVHTERITLTKDTQSRARMTTF